MPRSIRRRPIARPGILGVVAAGFLGIAGCGGSSTTPGPTGTVSVTINGFLPGITSAGTVSITGTLLSAPVVLNLPAASSGTAEVPVGSYHVSYTPPSGYEIAPGSSGEVDVTIVEDETTEVVVNVVQVSGTLQITVTGVNSGAPNGGSAEILRTDIAGQTPDDISIPTNGSSSTEVTVGTYSVTYTPPPDHTVNGGVTNPQTVVVTEATAGTATFAVTYNPPATTGTLQVVVTGLGGGAPNGGVGQALRTDIGGQTPFNMNVPIGGTTQATVAAGTYSVTYAAPAGHVVAPGVTNPQSVVVAVDGTGTATFDVDEAVAPSGVVFHSDWSTALGTTDAALKDTNQDVPWPTLTGNGVESAVVKVATGLDFPVGLQNVLHVQAANYNGGGSQARFVRVTGAWGVPAIGQSLYYRTYLRVMVPNTATAGSSHPIQDGNATGDTNWELSIRSVNEPTWTLRMNSNATAFPSNFFAVSGLTKGVTYRVEWQIHRISTTTFNMHARVYNSAGTLLFDDDDFVAPDGTTRLNSNPALTFRDVNNLNGLNYGTNGAFQGNTADDFPADFFYGGAMCVRTDDWCGPYSGGI